MLDSPRVVMLIIVIIFTCKADIINIVIFLSTRLRINWVLNIEFSWRMVVEWVGLGIAVGVRILMAMEENISNWKTTDDE